MGIAKRGEGKRIGGIGVEAPHRAEVFSEGNIGALPRADDRVLVLPADLQRESFAVEVKSGQRNGRVQFEVNAEQAGGLLLFLSRA